MNNKKIIQYLEESRNVAEKQFDMVEDFIDIAENVKTRMERGGILFFCGNGGSAADSQHLAAELIGRFKKIENHLSQLL